MDRSARTWEPISLGDGFAETASSARFTTGSSTVRGASSMFPTAIVRRAESWHRRIRSSMCTATCTCSTAATGLRRTWNNHLRIRPLGFRKWTADSSFLGDGTVSVE